MTIESKIMKRTTAWLFGIALIFLGLTSCLQKNNNNTAPTLPVETEEISSSKPFYQFTLDETFGNGYTTQLGLLHYISVFNGKMLNVGR